jgi:hypothetical protein
MPGARGRGLWTAPEEEDGFGVAGLLALTRHEELRRKTASGSVNLPALTHHGGVVVDQPASAHPEEKSAAGSRIRPPWPAPTAEWA